MGQKDITEKILADFEDVFADIVNGFLFNGEQVVSSDELVTAMPISQYKADTSKIHQEERDVCKKWERQNINLAVLGLENQTDICKEMVARVIGYDGASYRSQIIPDKDGKIVYPIAPVVTLVLYFGDKKWNAPRRLSELLDIPERVRPFFNDYEIHVFEVAFIEETDLCKFQSDFRAVAEYFVKKRIYGKSYEPSPQALKHVDAVLKLLEVLTNDPNWLSIPAEIREKEDVSMCEVLEYREKIGETNVNNLNKWLFSQDRVDDVRKASQDPVYQKKLFKEMSATVQ